jgi:septal ring factor EnvC (AmiA/AmiB activator)
MLVQKRIFADAAVKKISLLVGVLLMGFLLLSCARWGKIDGTTPEEREKIRTSKDQLWDENRQYKKNNQLLQDQIAHLRNSAAKNETDIKKLHMELAGLRRENTVLKEEKRKLDKALAKKEAVPAVPAVSMPAEYVNENIEKLKIKILGGDGTLRTANRLAATLKEMGYKIRLTHLAPTSNFTGNTVYYAADFKKDGEDLAARIGGGAKAKALTWPSEFDLIVVAGKKSEN